jgi:hypothetical protein
MAGKSFGSADGVTLDVILRGMETEPHMPKRALRVVKRLSFSTTPMTGACEFCEKEFKVPPSALAKTAAAEAYLQEQFDRHKCQRDEA